MKRPDRRAFVFIIEAIGGATILIAALAALTMAQIAHARCNAWAFAGQRCTGAARAQMDALEVTGAPLDRQTVETLWPDVTLSVRRGPGLGPWKGMEKIEVTATARVHEAKRQRSITLTRYLPKEDTP